MKINNYEFKGNINGFILDENSIDGKYVISDIENQVLCVSKKIYMKLNIDKKINEINLYDKFIILLNAYLLNNPEYIIFKNVFCDFTCDEITKLKLLFRDLKKKNKCKFIICSKNLDIINDLCDYVTSDTGSFKCLDHFKKKKGDVPFCVSFVRELEEKNGKKIGVMHSEISDLAKDVYRYVR